MSSARDHRELSHARPEGDVGALRELAALAVAAGATLRLDAEESAKPLLACPVLPGSSSTLR